MYGECSLHEKITSLQLTTTPPVGETPPTGIESFQAVSAASVCVYIDLYIYIWIREWIHNSRWARQCVTPNEVGGLTVLQSAHIPHLLCHLHSQLFSINFDIRIHAGAPVQVKRIDCFIQRWASCMPVDRFWRYLTLLFLVIRNM